MKIRLIVAFPLLPDLTKSRKISNIFILTLNLCPILLYVFKFLKLNCLQNSVKLHLFTNQLLKAREQLILLNYNLQVVHKQLNNVIIFYFKLGTNKRKFLTYMLSVIISSKCSYLTLP